MCLLVWSSETKTLVFFCSPFDSFNVAKILIAELKHTTFRVWSIAINRRKVDFGIRCDSSSNLRRNEHIALSSILWATSRKEEEETFHSSSYQLYKIVLCEQKKHISSSAKDKYKPVCCLLVVNDSSSSSSWWFVVVFVDVLRRFCHHLSCHSNFQCVQELISKLAVFTLENMHQETLVDAILIFCVVWVLSYSFPIPILFQLVIWKLWSKQPFYRATKANYFRFIMEIAWLERVWSMDSCVPGFFAVIHNILIYTEIWRKFPVFCCICKWF